jgi:signal transduction histidine kinase
MEIPNVHPIINGDIGMIERVISNVVENALNYTPSKGSVTIRISDLDQHIIIEISDNGRGVSDKDLPNIFDRFYRGTGVAIPGTGLGLAIVKEILTLHRGNIEVESQKDIGSTFTISLPLN